LWRFHLQRLAELINTFEKDEVEQKLQELSGYSYQGMALTQLLRPVKEKVSQFDFLTAAEEVAKLLKEGEDAHEKN